MVMTNGRWKTSLALCAALLVAVGSAVAQPPEGKGNAKGDAAKGSSAKGNSAKGQSRKGEAAEPRTHFGDSQKSKVRLYYGARAQKGFCPPGLAKKNNGCMPPGQAKKWAVGQPLPREVVYYEVPRRLVVEIGLPPPGYKYVRVAADILMIAIGTGIVVDAIEDILAL